MGGAARVIVGIDCGATSTKATAFKVLDDGSLKPLVRVVCGPSNPASTDRAVGQANIMKCLRKIAEETGLRRFDLVAFSAAGTGHGAWRDYYVEAVLNTGSADNVMVFEDYLVAHYACFEGRPGIVAISGTGSSAYGVGKDGKEVKVGGWGHLIDDGGSAWHAGKEGIKAALKYLDGRGPYTALLGDLIQYLGIDEVGEVITKVYGHEAPKTLIAGFAKHVVQEAMNGDEVAKEIIAGEARELTELLIAAGKLLGDEELPFCVVGGFYEGAKALLKPAMLNELNRKVRNSPRLREALKSLEEAAAEMAMKSLNRRLSKDMLRSKFTLH